MRDMELCRTMPGGVSPGTASAPAGSATALAAVVNLRWTRPRRMGPELRAGGRGERGVEGLGIGRGDVGGGCGLARTRLIHVARARGGRDRAPVVVSGDREDRARDGPRRASEARGGGAEGRGRARAGAETSGVRRAGSRLATDGRRERAHAARAARQEGRAHRHGPRRRVCPRERRPREVRRVARLVRLRRLLRAALASGCAMNVVRACHRSRCEMIRIVVRLLLHQTLVLKCPKW